LKEEELSTQAQKAKSIAYIQALEDEIANLMCNNDLICDS